MKLLPTMAILVVLSAPAFAGARFTPPQLPESPYDDRESSTNIVFDAGGDEFRVFTLAFDLLATPSNTVQAAFGVDANLDGELDWQETDFLAGWRCGGWFFRDKTVEAESFAAAETGLRRMELKVFLGRDRRPIALEAMDSGVPLGFSVSPGMFRSNWNMARVTVRNGAASSYSIEGGVFALGFSVRVR